MQHNEHLLCSLPEQPRRQLPATMDPMRRYALIENQFIWLNGTELHYCYLHQDAKQIQIVEQAWANLQKLVGLKFVRVTDAKDAEIRIAFEEGAGSWSYVGRANLTIPKDKPTLNFGWDLEQQPSTAEHELGHALGLEHEHQNPRGGIEWNVPEVIKWLRGPPNNWDQPTIEHNVLNKIEGAFGTEWDPDSIMHYSFHRGLIKKPKKYRDGINPACYKKACFQNGKLQSGLSKTDEEFLKQLYPSHTPQYQELFDGQPVAINISSGQQVEYKIVPKQNGKYVLETFGQADTVMGLFELEQSGSKLTYITADDDGGAERNARIERILKQGKEYLVQIRLYSKYATGVFGLALTKI